VRSAVRAFHLATFRNPRLGDLARAAPDRSPQFSNRIKGPRGASQATTSGIADDPASRWLRAYALNKDVGGRAWGDIDSSRASWRAYVKFRLGGGLRVGLIFDLVACATIIRHVNRTRVQGKLIQDQLTEMHRLWKVDILSHRWMDASWHRILMRGTVHGDLG